MHKTQPYGNHSRPRSNGCQRGITLLPYLPSSLRFEYNPMITKSKDMAGDGPTVVFLPYERRMPISGQSVKLNSLSFPLGRPYRLSDNESTLSNLRASDHLIVYPTGAIVRRLGINVSSQLIRLITGIRANISLLAACEPRVLHAKYFHSLHKTHRRFYRVLTRNDDLIKTIPNGIFFLFGSTWISNWTNLEIMKTRNCSLIASKKKSLPGHRLRHHIVNWAQNVGIEIDALGYGYRPIQPKSAGLAPYRFSVVIENIREQHYFTEKLVDAILCKTVPIYWGCPNISDYFDTSGMIICQNKDELYNELTRINEDRYHRLLPQLCNAYPQAEYWADLEGRATRAVLGVSSH